MSKKSKNSSTDTELTKLPHSRNFSFRAPLELRRAIKHAAKKQEQSQSDFIATAIDEFLKQVDESGDINDILLPENFEIPHKESKLVAIRIAHEVVDTIQERAPRFYQSATRLILWASTIRLYKLAAQAEKSD